MPPVSRIPLVRQAVQRLAGSQEDVVLFESWHGRYCDNPRAISERLRVERPDLRQVWAVDGRREVPDWAATVSPDSVAYLRALGGAGHVVANTELPGYARKRSGARYLQTWHGTPLKRIAFDIADPAFQGSGRYLRNLRRDVERWDVLVSPNRFSTEVFRGAFGFTGDIAEIGHPRNDVLSAPEADDVRRRLRAELGIRPGQRVTLYAPTWRDGAGFALHLDLAAAADRLGDDHVLLLRTHHIDAGHGPAQAHPRVLDLSDRDEIRELYLAADVLVTDYSSAMFDFAVTGKPIVVFAYDLESYRDVLRGFYFDPAADGPGPVLRRQDEVVELLADARALAELANSSRYRSFRDRFCHLDDGRASSRAIEALLA